MLNISKIIVNADIVVDIPIHYNSPIGFLKKQNRWLQTDIYLLECEPQGVLPTGIKKKKIAE